MAMLVETKSDLPAHSEFGGSVFSKIKKCRGYARMNRYCENVTNPAAELGTAAHELAEFCLLFGLDSFDCLDLVFNDHIVDVPMAEAVQLYVSFIRDISLRYHAKPIVEAKVVLISIRNDVFGTSDCVFIIDNVLHVYDYKHGYEIIEVKNSDQLQFYATGVLDSFNLWKTITKVVTGIIQPRADHIDGSIRLHEYSIYDIHNWREEAREVVKQASLPDAPLNPGEHCTYCLASDHCRPRMERTIDLVYGEKPIETLNDDEIITMFKEVKTIKRNCKKIEEKALSLARQGVLIEDYKLVKGIVRAECKDEMAFIKAAEAEGVKKEQLYQTKLVSMTEAKKKMKASIVNQHFVKPESSSVLVGKSDRRPAISSTTSAVGRFGSVI